MTEITDLFRKTIEKDKLGAEVEYIPNYKTGLDILDYRNGRIEDSELRVGYDGGKITTVIGKSGTGKTALSIKIATNEVLKYENSQVVHLDFERGTNLARIQTISGLSKEELNKKYILMNSKIYSESLYSIVKSMVKIKQENFEKIKIDSGKLDKNGNKIYILPPTFVLVDSWANMIPKNISEEEELSGQMSATSIARQNNSIIKRLISPLEEGNINLIIINHITTKVEIGPVKTAAQLNYLSQDESIPGGGSAIYLANWLIKVQASSKLEPEKDFGIKGFKSFIQYIKTRSNESGHKFEMIYNQKFGYDNLLSNFNFLKGEGLLKGNGRAYYFDGMPDFKFTQKTFADKYKESNEFKEYFDNLVKENLMQYVSDSYVEEEPLELVELIDEEQNLYLGNDGKHYVLNEDGTATLSE